MNLELSTKQEPSFRLGGSKTGEVGEVGNGATVMAGYRRHVNSLMKLGGRSFISGDLPYVEAPKLQPNEAWDLDWLKLGCPNEQLVFVWQSKVVSFKKNVHVHMYQDMFS